MGALRRESRIPEQQLQVAGNWAKSLLLQNLQVAAVEDRLRVADTTGLQMLQLSIEVKGEI